MNNRLDKFEYDVAFSFAGEQRVYIDAVANSLQAQGINVFYDEFEQENLWGKNLVDHFEKIYGNQAKYIVMFLSKEYAAKDWPNYERQVVLERWIHEQNILLPVRFDDSKIKGLPDSIGYLDLRKLSPEKLAQAIIRKVSAGMASNSHKSENDKPEFRLPKKVIKVNPYEERKKFVNFVADELKRRCTHVKEFDFFDDDVGDKKQIRILHNGDVLYALDIYKKGIGVDSGVSFSYGIRSDYLSGYNAWGDFEWNLEKNEVVLNLNDMSLFDYFGGHQDSKLRYEDFVEKLWNKIIDLLEDDNN